ncbi:tonB-system energizer ExbB, partial [Pseudomonas sp. Env-94]
MTRHTNPASPTKLHSPSRAWRAIAAMLFSVLLAPTAAFADATAPAAPAAAEQNAATAATPAVAPVATDPAQA